jgi:DNA polymerase-3 subunit delta'
MNLQEEIEGFCRCLDVGRVAQAYIVVGAPRGEGKAFAEMALGALFCSGKKRPCGECIGCLQVSGRTHPDVFWVEPQKKSRIISIEQVRDLQKRVYHTSYEGGWKACVIVGADRLGDAAANAFLKTLEEPPGRSIFLLLTDSPQFLLPTIRSRCQQILLLGGGGVLPEPWCGQLLSLLSEANSPAEEGAVRAFARADRLVGLLREIRSEVEAEQKTEAEEGTVEESDETVSARIISRYREVRSGVMRAILGWYRDILLLVCGSDDTFVMNADHVEVLRKCASGRDREKALRDVEIVRDMNRKLERNVPEETVFGWGCSQLDRK